MENNLFISGFGEISFESSFVDNAHMLKRNSDDAAYFLNNRVTRYTDEEIAELIQSGDFSKTDLFVFKDKDRDGIIDPEDKIQYPVIFFYGKDAIKLEKIYNSVEPKENEVLIFIEDQTHDVFSSKKIFIKLGSERKEAFQNNTTEADVFINGVQKNGYGDLEDAKKVRDLILAQSGHVETEQQFYLVLSHMVGPYLEPITEVIDYLQDIPIAVLDTIINGLESLKFTDNDWNPKSAKKNAPFSPYFFPILQFYPKGDAYLAIGKNRVKVDTLNQLLVKGIDKTFSGINTSLDKDYVGFINTLEKLSLNLIDLKTPTHSPLYNLINQFKDLIKEVILWINDFILEGTLFYNALICGFINSLIDIFVGIFQIINLIFKANKYSTKLLRSTPDWPEYIDNLIQVLAKLDLKQIALELSAFFNSALVRLGEAAWKKITSINPAEIGYIIGFIIGFIVEQLLGAITFGSLNVSSAIHKGIEVFDSLMEAIGAILKRAFKKVGKSIFSSLESLIEFFSKGTDEVLEFIRDIWKALLKWIDELRIRKKRGPKWNESILRNGNHVSQKIIKKTKKNAVIQKYNNLDKLYEEAAEAKKDLDKITREFAYETGGIPGMRDETLNNGLKSRERSLEKTQRENEGRPELLVDVAGSKIVYLTLEDLYKALKVFDSKYKILRIKDRIQKPTTTGCRDILMNLKMKNGHIVELRFHIHEMDVVATGKGHKYYTERRTLEHKKDLTNGEIKRIQELTLLEKELYENAWKKILEN